jgi:hypothetical protein
MLYIFDDLNSYENERYSVENIMIIRFEKTIYLLKYEMSHFINI